MTNVAPLNDERTVCGSCCTELDGVSVRYGSRIVLSDVSLRIHCGELVAIIGPNGGGKSTLLRVILGEIPHAGTVRRHLSPERGRRRFRTGYVPQRLEFDFSSPVTAIDLFAASLSRWPLWLGHNGRIRRLAENALAAFEARELLDMPLGEMSGGQLQRVLLALAMTPPPDLLLLDEPVSGVDPSGVDLFYRRISDLRRQHHLGILLVTHDIAAASRHADRMVFLNQRIVCQGRPCEVEQHEAVLTTFGSQWTVWSSAGNSTQEAIA